MFAWARRRRLGKLLADRFPVPEEPWSESYANSHAELVGWLIDRPDILAHFARGQRLPRGYGAGFDERVVEYPWLLAQEPKGRLLDAGSTLNHEHVLDRVLPLLSELHVVTLAPEPVSFPERGISYVYADLRDLPYRDGYFDVVASLSTLEHVGMDASAYGADAPRSPDPGEEAGRAVAELARVVAPGGTMLVTVPYGASEDHGWFRQFDSDDLEELVTAARPARSTIAVYEHSMQGWQASSLEQAAGARYHDHHTEAEIPRDRAAAARAVACIRLDI